MTTITLSRGSTSVDMELHARGQDLLIARDVGKVEGDTIFGKIDIIKSQSDNPDPSSVDFFSASDRFFINAILKSSTAFDDAETLADLVKAHQVFGGGALTLDLSNVSSLGTFEVGVPDENALTLEYEPGQTQTVLVTLNCRAHRKTI